MVANPCLTKVNVAPTGAMSIQLERLLNSRNSDDLRISSASCSTFRHTMSPSALMDSNFTQSRRLLAYPGGLIGSPSYSKNAPLPMLHQNHAQTEVGYALMKFDTLQSFRNLSHAVRACHNNCQQCARVSQLSAGKSVLMLDKFMCTRHQRPVRK